LQSRREDSKIIAESQNAILSSSRLDFLLYDFETFRL
jgi:hypothetical protein